MHPPVSPEKREGMREMRELLPPTYPRIAKVAGLHVTTVREIASRENWPKVRFHAGTVMRPVSRKDQLAEEAARDRAETLEAISDPGRVAGPATRKHRRGGGGRNAGDPGRRARRAHRQGPRRRVAGR